MSDRNKNTDQAEKLFLEHKKAFAVLEKKIERVLEKSKKMQLHLNDSAYLHSLITKMPPTVKGEYDRQAELIRQEVEKMATPTVLNREKTTKKNRFIENRRLNRHLVT